MIDVREMRASRSNIIVMGITMIILGIIASLALDLPGGDEYLKDNLYVGHVIRVIMAAVVVGMAIIGMRPHLFTVTAYYLGSRFKVRNRKEATPYIDELAKCITQMIAIAIIWPVTIYALRQLFNNIYVSVDLRRIIIALIFIFLAILLYYLYRGYQAYQPISRITSGLPEVKPETPIGFSEITCSNCGKVNPFNAQFCFSCGKKLVQEEVRCPNCQAENVPEAKFCIKCGTSLTKR